MTVNMADMAYALKTLWPDNRISNQVYQNQPLFAMLKKDTKFGGENRVVAVRYADTAGRSNTFSTAQANKGEHKGAKFVVTRVKDYAVASVDGETIEASKGNVNSMVEALDTEMESAMHVLKRSIGQKLFRDGTGVVGRRGSLSGSVTTLAQAQDVVNFEVGDKLVVVDGSGAATVAPRDSGAVLTVTAVDREAGTITHTGTVTGYANNDWLIKQGDAAAGGALKCLAGLDAWLTTPGGSDSFFGLNRSVDQTRLAGQKMDISALPVDEGLIKALNRCEREGFQPSHLFLHPEQFSQLEYSLGDRVRYAELKVGQIGFNSIVLKGGVKVVADMNCPVLSAYGLSLAEWELASLGPVPRILNSDGNQILRESSADSYEVRCGFYGNLICRAPGHNIKLTMPAVP